MAKKKTKTDKEGSKEQDIKVSKFRRDLTVALSDDDLKERSKRLSHRIAEHDIREAEIAEENKRAKSKLKDIATDIRRLSNAVRDGAELREVQCEIRYNYTTGRVTEVRLDTGEILSERDMNEDERQKPLDLGDVDDEFDGDADDEGKAA